jgi:hypothetical protein
LLISLNLTISTFIHFPENNILHSSLWLNNASLCGGTTFSEPIYQLMDA